MARFLHSGKLGDLLFTLYTIKKLGGGDLYFNMTGGTLCRSTDYEFCKPLLEKQPYIHNVYTIKLRDEISNNRGEKMFCRQDIENPDFLILDNAWYWRHYNLHWIHKYAYTFGVTVNAEERILDGLTINDIPWEKRPITTQLTNRYRIYDDSFYAKLLTRPDVIRIGDKPDEIICNNMLEMANLIANSKFFVGNQSVCNSLAQNIQHPRLIEVDYEQGDAYPIGCFGFRTTNNIDNDINKLSEVSKYYWSLIKI